MDKEQVDALNAAGSSEQSLAYMDKLLEKISFLEEREKARADEAVKRAEAEKKQRLNELLTAAKIEVSSDELLSGSVNALESLIEQAKAGRVKTDVMADKRENEGLPAQQTGNLADVLRGILG